MFLRNSISLRRTLSIFRYAFSSAEESLNSEELEGRSENLKNIIRDYFSQENTNSDIELVITNL